MKRYQLLVLHVVALFALAGCSNDDITQDKGKRRFNRNDGVCRQRNTCLNFYPNNGYLQWFGYRLLLDEWRQAMDKQSHSHASTG